VIWVGWRQARTETLIAAAILALLALALVPSGIDMASTFHHDGLSRCLGPSPEGACEEAIRSFTSRFESLDNFVAWTTLVPGLIGALLATPFLLDLEHGTYRLAWTQSITRRSWIAHKLALATGAAVLAAVLLTAYLTWWHRPLVRLNGRLDNSIFDSVGTVVVGYVLFALGLGLAVGVLWRRAVPALVVAFGAYMGARIFVDVWLRQYVFTPLSVTWHRGAPEPASLYHAWILNAGPSDKFGHSLAPRLTFCSKAQFEAGRCPAFKDVPEYMHAVFEPASRFWLMQGVETAAFGGLGLVLIAFAAWWTHERVA
jgi:hypothetical protein